MGRTYNMHGCTEAWFLRFELYWISSDRNQ